MTKRGILGAALGLLLTMTLGTASAAAYAGHGFSLEVPEDWIPDTQVESIAYGWTNPEVTQEVTVSIADNDDFLNLYDLKEDDLPDIEELIASQYAQRLAESYQAQGHECTVRLEDTGVTLAEWNSQPAVLIDCRFAVTWAENGGEFPVYLHMGIQTSKEHSFVVAYMANDAADMDTLMDSGIMESFRVTEETYSGPSSPLASYADVIFSAAGTMLFAVSAWFGLRALMERKKKKQTDIQAGPGGRL